MARNLYVEVDQMEERLNAIDETLKDLKREIAALRVELRWAMGLGFVAIVGAYATIIQVLLVMSK